MDDLIPIEGALDLVKHINGLANCCHDQGDFCPWTENEHKECRVVREFIMGLIRERDTIRDALQEVLAVDGASFTDAGTPGNHYTKHICIACGSDMCYDECIIPRIRALLKKR